MNDSHKTTVLAAVVGGYFLGRTKKAKLALTAGALLAGRRLSAAPQDLLGKGLRQLPGTPESGMPDGQVKGQLLTAARTAATSVANRRITAWCDSLRERTERLQEAAEPESEPGQAEGNADSEDEEGEERQEGEEETGRHAAEERDEAPPQRRASRPRQPRQPESARKRGASREPAAHSGSSSGSRPQSRTSSGTAAKRSAARSAPRR